MTSRMTTSITVALLALVGGPSVSSTQKEHAIEPPLAFPVEDAQVRIVGATFVSKLQGTNARFEEQNMGRYRGLVLTVEITKIPSRELTLVAQDLTLHYRYGATSDVAKCSGLSTFSKEKDVDRAMSLYSGGWGRSSTGLSTTEAGTVYVDMFFQNMEPDTSELHLFVAQPIGASFETAGWR